MLLMTGSNFAPREFQMARKKRRDGIPRLEIPKNATMRQIYAKYRKEFTAADLQQYTELEEGLPVEHILAEMEAIQRREAPKPLKQA
jgi:hypothetical protein